MRPSPSLIWVLVFLVIVVLILQIIHLVLFSCLEMRSSEKMKASVRSLQLKTANRQFFPYFRMDTRGHYQIYYSILDRTKTNPSPSYAVTMVTHCSPNNMHYLPVLVDRWKGPVSLAVFSCLEDFQFTLCAIHSYARCYPNIEQHVQFHLVVPLVSVDLIRELNFTCRMDVPCHRLTFYLGDHLQTKNYALTGVPYPNNLLRNVGRLGSRTKFVLANDIDILPNSGLSGDVHQFLESDGTSENLVMRKTAFVLPVFEVQESSPVPTEKSELIEAVKEGTVRQFYTELCYRCQSNTGYDEWLLEEQSSNTIDIAYLVEYQPMWEPFVITHKSAPLYEERFKQYGYNRISNMCELHMAGFTFAVLDSGFLVHQGFKRKGNFHTKKDDDNAVNRALYQEFVEELHVKYPDFQGSCRNAA